MCINKIRNIACDNKECLVIAITHFPKNCGVQKLRNYNDLIGGSRRYLISRVCVFVSRHYIKASVSECQCKILLDQNGIWYIFIRLSLDI